MDILGLGKEVSGPQDCIACARNTSGALIGSPPAPPAPPARGRAARRVGFIPRPLRAQPYRPASCTSGGYLGCSPPPRCAVPRGRAYRRVAMRVQLVRMKRRMPRGLAIALICCLLAPAAAFADPPFEVPPIGGTGSIE